MYLGAANAALGLAKAEVAAVYTIGSISFETFTVSYTLPQEANALGITHVLNVSDLYALAPGKHGKLVVEWARA